MIQNSTGIQTLSEIKELKAGTEYSMAIMKNGDTYTWGSNENNKLGTTQDNYTVYPKKMNKQTHQYSDSSRAKQYRNNRRTRICIHMGIRKIWKPRKQTI